MMTMICFSRFPVVCPCCHQPHIVTVRLPPFRQSHAQSQSQILPPSVCRRHCRRRHAAIPRPRIHRCTFFSRGPILRSLPPQFLLPCCWHHHRLLSPHLFVDDCLSVIASPTRLHLSKSHQPPPPTLRCMYLPRPLGPPGPPVRCTTCEARKLASAAHRREVAALRP